MAASKDLVHLEKIRFQVFQDDTWQWVQWFSWADFAPGVISPPPTTGDFANLGVDHMFNLKIPNASVGRPFKIGGSFAAPGGTWVIKCGVGKNAQPGNWTLYTFPIDHNSGWFEFEASGLHLGVNDFTYVWVSVYSHTPPNPQGIWSASLLRIETADEIWGPGG